MGGGSERSGRGSERKGGISALITDSMSMPCVSLR